MTSGFDRHPFKDSIVIKTDMSAVDWLVDVVIAAGAFGFGLLQLTLSANLLIPDDFMRRLLGVSLAAPSQLAIIATLLTCLPLIFRRKVPWISFGLSLVVWIAFESGFEIVSLSLVSPLVALFTLAYSCPRNQSLIAVACTLVIVFVAGLSSISSTMSKLLLLQNSVLVLAVGFAGYSLYVRQEYLEEAKQRIVQEESLRISDALRAQEAERSRIAEAKSLIETERSRIARELHDITAHSLTAINVQSSAALRLMDVSPDQAKESIQSIKGISKDALTEIRSLIAVLKSDPEEGTSAEFELQFEPVYGIGDIETLQRYLNDAGVACEMRIDQDVLKDLPAYVGIALFGIAREAVTNIVKHARAVHVRMDIAVDVVTDGKVDGAVSAVDAVSPHFVRMVISDDGVGMDDVTMDRGHGLQGMKERVDALGGTFDIESALGEGTNISVSIPLMGKTDVDGQCGKR